MPPIFRVALNNPQQKEDTVPMRYSGDPRWITTRYRGTCANCAAPIRRGEAAFYYPRTRDLFCNKQNCGPTEASLFYSAAADEEAWNGVGSPYAS